MLRDASLESARPPGRAATRLPRHHRVPGSIDDRSRCWKAPNKLTVGEVPVDGFWSLTAYNSQGYLQPNPDNVYSVNSITARKAAHGSVTIQFGGCSGEVQNCIPITEGWNYTVRLFKPRAEVIDGTWQFALAQPEM
ncbi:DUF1214 domain-containing protein [Bradyrhizobium sp. BRP14]|nr:DUF1214 domain-containing protein [Bradyrhizobium sp. BRP14]